MAVGKETCATTRKQKRLLGFGRSRGFVINAKWMRYQLAPTILQPFLQTSAGYPLTSSAFIAMIEHKQITPTTAHLTRKPGYYQVRLLGCT